MSLQLAGLPLASVAQQALPPANPAPCGGAGTAIGQARKTKLFRPDLEGKVVVTNEVVIVTN
jgi:hypothetical protein